MPQQPTCYITMDYDGRTFCNKEEKTKTKNNSIIIDNIRLYTLPHIYHESTE